MQGRVRHAAHCDVARQHLTRADCHLLPKTKGHRQTVFNDVCTTILVHDIIVAIGKVLGIDAFPAIAKFRNIDIHSVIANSLFTIEKLTFSEITQLK